MPFIQATDEVLDYAVDYQNLLPHTDSISTTTWTADSGISVANEGHSGRVASVWVSAVDATVGDDYSVKNHSVSAEGREVDQTITIKVREV